ncbi:ESX-1 secretion-associated protein [Nocardia arthritidis]|uniref:WXG100 family type VII secretion target n=1 Tax=Nocardia arthritidis TaxID=228602 RepID=A0A6G9YCE0_9NOCA|nr:ESX-1 secretion-associated protein [Nocardia arthritidis]QIS10737.1 WXG100 family type VII secretion target [Nocardia arthritidis]
MGTSGGTPRSSQSLSVVPDSVREVGAYIYDLANTLKSALDSAGREVESVTTGSWTGDAATGFSTGWNEVSDGGGQIISALTGLAEKLGVTADTYQRRDRSNADSLSNSSLDLPPLS